jgi:retinoid hydroxylase
MMGNKEESAVETLRELPSRFAWPLIGDTLGFMSDPGGLLASRAKELGPVFEISVLGHPTACFVGPDAFSLLLDDANVGRASANPPHVEAIFNPKAVPFLDGAERTRRKRLLMSAFSESALEGYLPSIEAVLARHIAKWEKQKTLEWVPLINSLGFSIAGALFIGSDPSSDDSDIENAFGDVATGLLSIPINLPFLPYGKALKSRDFILTAIDRALDAHEKTGEGGTNVLSRLMQARAGEEKLSREELRIETFHFFGAYAAVIGGLSFLASALGQHEDVAKRAREEVMSVSPTGSLTIASLKKLTYLDWVTREVRRATPILPLTFFGSIKRDLVFQGIRIPKGHHAIGCIGATLLDAGTYPEPTRFDPMRWEKPNATQEAAWIPHGGGAHLDGHRCAGEMLAHVMMKIFAATLLRDYAWTLDKSQDLSPTRNKLFATPVGGLHATLTKLEK